MVALFSTAGASPCRTITQTINPCLSAGVFFFYSVVSVLTLVFTFSCDGWSLFGFLPFSMLRLLSFNERPHTFRSLVCTSLTSFCSDTLLLAGYRSSVRYLLFFFPSDLSSVAFSALWSILPLLGFLYRSHANHARKPPCFVFSADIVLADTLSEYSFQFWFLSNFLRLLPRRGKESSLFIPSFPLFLAASRRSSCRPLTTLPISSLEFSLQPK